MSDLIVIVAGGTGGHINAALSVGREFKKDFKVQYLSGQRYLDKKLFPADETIFMNSQPLRTKNPIIFIINLGKNMVSFLKLFAFFIGQRPLAVIGAGGYVCGPSLLAAKFLFIPIFIIEQNAIMGLTNRILSKISNLIFLNFKQTKGSFDSDKVRVVGNPIREEIAFTLLPARTPLSLLVFGGSLGAAQINEIVFKLIKKEFPFNLNILHQVGSGNLHQVKNYSSSIEYKQVEYIDDMQDAYSQSHIILCRSGASTISELRVVKRPTLIVPFPLATDNHQYFNAINLKEENLFPVEIFDYNNSIDQLVEQVYIAVKDYKDWLEKHDVSASASENTVLKIKEMVLNYVRNQ